MTNPIQLTIFVAVVLCLILVFPSIAALVAPRDRRLTFFCLTLLVLPGPIGVGLAAIANPRKIGTELLDDRGEPQRRRSFGDFITGDLYADDAQRPDRAAAARGAEDS